MSFIGLLQQSITLKVVTGFDGFGKPESSGSTSYPARVEPENLEVIDLQGRTTIANMRIFLEPDVPITPQASVTYDGADHEIISVEKVPGRDGSIHHLEVLIR